MSLLYTIIIIALISLALALRSLYQVTKIEEIKKVQEKLKKGKVIFHQDSLSSDSSGE
jgi:hypothetical protein